MSSVDPRSRSRVGSVVRRLGTIGMALALAAAVACGGGSKKKPTTPGAGLAGRGQGLDLVAVGQAAVHLPREVERVAPLVGLEQRPLAGQALERHREGVLRRLADGDVAAVADQPLLDDLAAEQDADPQRPLPAAGGGSCARGGHQNGAFCTLARMRGRKSCFKVSHS